MGNPVLSISSEGLKLSAEVVLTLASLLNCARALVLSLQTAVQ